MTNLAVNDFSTTLYSQLRYDGLEEIAMKLTQEVRPKAPCPPSAHLFQQVKKAKHMEGMVNVCVETKIN